MNKVYKVIFNRALGQYVVASENAKSASKTDGNSVDCSDNSALKESSQSNLVKLFKVGALFSSILLLGQTSVYADLVVSGSPSYPNTIDNSSDYIVVGEANHVTTSKTVSIFGINNNAQNAENVLLSGNRNYVISSNSASPSSYMTLVGNVQAATNSSHVSSLGSNNSFYGDYVGIVGETNQIGGTPTGANKASNVYGLGFNNKIGTQTKSSNIQFIGSNSNFDGNNIYAIGDNLTSQGNNNVLIGGQVKTIGSSNTAVGNSATVEGRSSTAIGANAAALSNSSTAVGYIARANADNSVAVGNQATVSVGNNNSVALGSNSNANGVSLKNDAYLTNTKATAEMNIANGTSQRRITGLADGALDTDATTVRQLKVVDNKVTTTKTELTEAGLNFGGNTGDAVHKNLGQQLNIIGGADVAADQSSASNVITRTTPNGDIQIELLKNVNFDSVSTGNATLNSTGLTIKEGPSITTNGVDAGGKVVTNVADGVADTDAANLGQLVKVDEKVDGVKTELTNQITETNSNLNQAKEQFNTEITNTNNALNTTKEQLSTQIVQSKEDVINAGLNFGGNTGSTVHKNLGEQLNIVGGADVAADQSSAGNVITRTTPNGDIQIELLKNVNFDSVSTGNATLNSTGLTIKEGPSITTNGVDAGGKVVTNVADGVAATDAVNKGQLDGVIAQQGILDGSVVKYDGTSKDKITLQGKDGTVISNVKDGVASTDAVNLGQLVKVDEKVDGVKTELTNQITETNSNLNQAKEQFNTEITNTNNALNTTKEQLSTQIVQSKEDVINAGLNFGGNTGSTVHKNLGEQLNIIGGADVAADQSSASNVITRTTPNGDIQIELLKNVNFDSVSTGNATLNTNGLTLKDGPSITTNGIDAGGKVVTNVADGVAATDAVNKGQLDGVIAQQGILDGSVVKYDGTSKDQITLQGKDGTVISNVKDGVANTDAVNLGQLVKVDEKVDGVKTELTNQITETNSNLNQAKEQFNTEITNTNNALNTTKEQLSTQIVQSKEEVINAGLNFGGNTGDAVHKNLGEQLNIIGGADVAADQSSASNVITRTTPNGDIQIELLKNVNFDSVSTGNATLNSTGLTIKEGPSITTNGVDAGGKVVTNVADGVAATDAVNKGQLDGVIAQQGILDGSVVKYDGTSKDKITLQGKDGTVISNVKDGVASTDAVNLGQLVKVDEKVDGVKTDLTNQITETNNTLNTTKEQLSTQIVQSKEDVINAGLNFGGNTGSTVHKNLGEQLNIVGGADVAADQSSASNVITRTTPNGDIQIELLKNVNFDSVSTGNATLNTNGLTLKDGPSITTNGIDAGGKVVTNVADGAVKQGSSDAVNGGQISNITTSIKNSIGGETVVKNDGSIITTNIGGTGKNTIDEAIHSVNAKVDNGITDLQNEGMSFAANTGKTVHRKLGQQLNITGGADVEESESSAENVVTRTTEDGIKIELLKDVKFDSINVGGNIFNHQGLFISNGPSITVKGIDAGNKTISNVADGVNANDAVNKGQLDKLKDEVTQEIGKIPSLDNVVKYDQDSKDSITLGGEEGTTIKNVADGAVKEGSKEAVNGGQLWNVQQQVDQNTSDINNIQNNIENINNGKAGLVQQETANSNITVGKDTGGKVVDMSGKDGDRTIQGVKGGEISATSNQVVNGSQVHKISESFKNVIGGETTLNSDGTLTANNIGGTGQNTIDGAIGSLDNKITNLGDQLQQVFYDTNGRIDTLRKDLSAGISAAMAVGNLPQPTEAGKSMISAGVSGYGGEGAVAIGVSAITDNNKIIWKFGGTADTRSNVSGSVSVGYQW